MTIKELSKKLAKIDQRPYHPEDYEGDAKKIIRYVGSSDSTIKFRLAFLEMNGDLINGYLSVKDFMLTGILRDDYTGEILYRDCEEE